MDEKKHMWMMVLACGLPLLIILALPLFGIKGNFTWIALIAMFAMHIFMMGMTHKGEDRVEGKQRKNREYHHH